MDQEQISLTNASDYRSATRSIPNIRKPLTLEEAIARALKYNFEHRVKIFEHALATGKLQAGQYDMMPKLLTEAGYSWRNNSNSRQTSASATTVSSENQSATADLNFYWSFLDFGLGYYNAQENADRVMIAAESRRRVMHSLVQNVEVAFWRAAAAQKLEKKVKNTIKIGESALQRSRLISLENIRPPEEALRYQRNLLENLRLLEKVNAELSAARNELTRLIGAKPGSTFEIDTSNYRAPIKLNVPIERLEKLALTNNPDLRINHYQSRIAVLETKRVMLKLLPNISFNTGLHYDDDKFLTNQNWQDAGLFVSYNLFDILSAPAHSRTTQLGVDLAVAKRIAVQMSLLAQVHLAVQDYSDALKAHKRANEIHDVDQQLAQIALNKERSQVASELDRISSDVTAILSEVRYYHSIAKLHEAESRIQATVGLEPRIGNLDNVSLSVLTEQVQANLKNPNLFGVANSEESDILIRMQDSKPKQLAWLQVGAYKVLENARDKQAQTERKLMAIPGVMNVVSKPSLRYENGLYLVQFGPFKEKSALTLASVLQKTLNSPVTVLSY
ncbi:TolC family protein [Neptuniibacter sp.]|uniref:TolC family protein n=1 Tax=Neptuniibacter sp. TaxID=1962643 RepID=UPI002628C39E|nr:TolC family protein [Neptuniibacter sp.]MCP4596538.1 TolC family protein [Neptuniibacter sp.]